MHFGKCWPSYQGAENEERRHHHDSVACKITAKKFTCVPFSHLGKWLLYSYAFSAPVFQRHNFLSPSTVLRLAWFITADASTHPGIVLHHFESTFARVTRLRPRSPTDPTVHDLLSPLRHPQHERNCPLQARRTAHAFVSWHRPTYILWYFGKAVPYDIRIFHAEEPKRWQGKSIGIGCSMKTYEAGGIVCHISTTSKSSNNSQPITEWTG